MGGPRRRARELVPELIDEVLAAGGTVLVSDHRGETVRLPGARPLDGRRRLADRGDAAGRPRTTLAVVEVAVPAARVAGTVARLRADGHQILRVRPDASIAAPEARPAAPLGVAGAARPAEPPLGIAGAADQPEAADAVVEPAAGEPR